ncbi:hypothetical protein JX265_009826 [Neoarthrinium moseri]|uniref:O-methyltransferase n=1 Tax=Neoarthrinium moseri TaxID=1658444 RepID=A0A9P9WFD5_9PEZI|nr:hypothetical protein JX265_009826 [Neoarthrinium moseri]
MDSEVPAVSPAQLLMHESLGRIVTMTCLRSIIELRLYDLVPEAGTVSLTQLAKSSNASEEILIRLLRPLLASGIFASPRPREYIHTPGSIGFRQPAIRAAFLHGFDETLPCFLVQHRWLADNGWKSPELPDNCPFSMTHGGDSLFGHLEKNPEKAEVFNRDQEMEFIGIVGVYPFGQELKWSGPEDVLVDVGGGKGQASLALTKAYPELHRRVVLQDQAPVLKSVEHEVQAVVKEMRAYNFFDPQPVKGAAFYYLRRILCDWPDKACKIILQNQAEAMDSHSRLLIAAFVVPEVGCDFLTAASDAVMMTYAGKERTEAQFRQLLESVGLYLTKVWQTPGELQAVLEARLS